MHTFVIKGGTPDSPEDVRIHHNGDWSGSAHLTANDHRGHLWVAEVPGWCARILVARMDPTHPDIAGEELT